jgi:hypothetical protein
MEQLRGKQNNPSPVVVVVSETRAYEVLCRFAGMPSTVARRCVQTFKLNTYPAFDNLIVCLETGAKMSTDWQGNIVVYGYAHDGSDVLSVML